MLDDRTNQSVASKRKLVSSFTTLLLLGGAGDVSAAPSHTTANEPIGYQTSFQPTLQPLALKVAVTLGGAALIGAELWWFILSKPQAK